MRRLTLAILTFFLLIVTANEGLGDDLLLNFGPQELVQADGVDIVVPGYSVPCFADLNNDKLNDLVIGEGGGFGDAKIRVYSNVGTEASPQFSDYFYAQSSGADLTCPASGCLGCFPRVVHWDADPLKDLLVGQADGIVKIFLNIGTDEDPVFDAGQSIKIGPARETLDVGKRATPTLLDWNNDNMADLVVGALDGTMRVFQNCGCSGGTPPTFYHTEPSGVFVQEDAMDLFVPSGRSSPVILDLDYDGKKDILTGNTDGQLLFYRNVGTDAQPSFSGYSLVESGGVPIDLPGAPRSRPFVCHWTGDGHFGPIDGYPDVLIGSGDGKIRLYRGIPTPSDLDLDGDVDFEDFAQFADDWLQAGSRLRDRSSR